MRDEYKKRQPIKRHMDPYHEKDAEGAPDEDREGIIEGRNAVLEACLLYTSRYG